MAKHNLNSELVIMDEKAIATHAAKGTIPMPNISSVNVTKSSKVHIGPKIYTVTQTVENKEIVKGHFFGLELVSARRLRCSVAVFLCWAFLVATCLSIYLIYFAIYKHQVRLDIGLNASWYLRRGDWQAMKTYGEKFLDLPVQYVIIGHSAGYFCKEKYACIKNMLAIQNDHFKRDFDDIGPNFLVSGNGIIFEGRGANVIGAMVKYWNLRSISIMFMGDYRRNDTDPIQFKHINTLLELLVEEYVLRSDYIVFGHCQVSPDTISPGIRLVKRLSAIKHWNATNEDRCLLG